MFLNSTLEYEADFFGGRGSVVGGRWSVVDGRWSVVGVDGRWSGSVVGIGGWSSVCYVYLHIMIMIVGDKENKIELSSIEIASPVAKDNLYQNHMPFYFNNKLIFNLFSVYLTHLNSMLNI